MIFDIFLIKKSNNPVATIIVRFRIVDHANLENISTKYFTQGHDIQIIIIYD